MCAGHAAECGFRAFGAPVQNFVSMAGATTRALYFEEPIAA